MSTPSTTRTSRRSGSPKPSSGSSRPPEPAPASDGSPPRQRVAVVGGGTGLATVLRGLKHLVGGRLCALTGIVTMADDGGSSGRLRRDFGVLPPGDVRSCLVALADDEALLSRLFQYRFPGGEGLSGHSFGNLLLTALTGITGDFYQAVLTAEAILSVRGRILPSTLTDVRLRAAGRSGRIYEGESAVGRSGERLELVALEPEQPPAFPAAVEAIAAADLILLGPGSLYTSILPNLLIPGIRQAVHESRAPVVLVLNLMTQPGETDRMDAADHLEAIDAHAGAGLIDAVLADTSLPPKHLRAHYALTGSMPVAVDRAALEQRGVRLLEAPLIADGALIRHEPARLAEAVAQLLDAGPDAVALPAEDPAPG